MQMRVGFNNAGTYKELGGKDEVASRDVAWTKELSKKFTSLYQQHDKYMINKFLVNEKNKQV